LAASVQVVPSDLTISFVITTHHERVRVGGVNVYTEETESPTSLATEVTSKEASAYVTAPVKQPTLTV
jgi:hypothetical protein